MRTVHAHFDLDAYFASVETALRPALENKPVAVGGTGPGGIITSANYQARAHGVKAAMPVAHARALARDLVVIAPRMEAYRRVSAAVAAVAAQFGDTTMTSPDEGTVRLDVPDDDPWTAAEAGAAALRTAIRERTGLSASVGVATSRSVAKIGSDLAKPGGLRIIADGDVDATLGPLPVGTLAGVGPVTGEKLTDLGIATVADLAATPLDTLTRIFGARHGAALHAAAHGADPPPALRPSHQAGSEHTFDRSIHDPGEISALARAAAGEAYLRRGDKTISAVTVKLRGVDRTDLTRTRAVRPPTLDLGWLRVCVDELTDAAIAAINSPVRLIGVSYELSDDPAQPELFPPDEPLDVPTPRPPTLAEVAWAHMAVHHPRYGDGELLSYDDTAGWTVRFGSSVKMFAPDAPLTYQ